MRAKYCLLFTLSLLFTHTLFSNAQGEEIHWRTDLKEAARQARAENKAMLVQIGASWCGFCHKMEKETYQNPKVIKHVNACFIPILVDADQNAALVEAVGVNGLPTTAIITPQLKIVKKISGYVDAPEMEGHLNKICLATHEQAAPAGSKQPIKKMSQKKETPQFAFKGICLVSMLDDQLLEQGTAEFTSEYQGRKLCFVSQEHKQKFDANPERYWPAFGGTCRVSQKDQNRAVEGDPHAGGVYREKLVFFSSEAERDRFSSNPSFYLMQK